MIDIPAQHPSREGSQELQENAQGSGSVIATGISFSVLAGSVAGLITYYIHVKYNISLPEDQEQNLQTLFTTFLTGVGMFGHLIIRKLVAKYLT